MSVLISREIDSHTGWSTPNLIMNRAYIGWLFTLLALTLSAGRPFELTLFNMDVLTRHNFTLKATDPGLELETDISPGTSVTVRLTPEVPGTYTFYCNKKLLFMKSHRERGMEGKLIVRR